MNEREASRDLYMKIKQSFPPSYWKDIKMPAKDLMILGNHIDKDYLVKTQREFNMIMEHILSFAELSQFTACQTFFTKNCINMEEIGEESE